MVLDLNAGGFSHDAAMQQMNAQLHERSQMLGVQYAQDSTVNNLVKNMGLGHSPEAMALGGSLAQIGPVQDDGLGQQSVSSAGIAMAQQAQQSQTTDLGGNR